MGRHSLPDQWRPDVGDPPTGAGRGAVTEAAHHDLRPGR